MIKGTGLDIVEIDRIKTLWEKHGERFSRKILTDAEMTQLPRKHPVPRLAALFAGKEAAVKALGTGFARGVHFHCVEILHAPSGKPEIHFLDKGLDVMKELGALQAHISLTHEKGHAAAVVILEG
ncbi:holo-ACP synthase [Salidesulfovibrio onnuriiensis]|uniref:holo-ACP synthase n=1 Tax=Salidesulfovibrio onnuriiensis TaxID=2583823 RepID=UPI0011C76DF6|nr:holo-ACP synthase [Salidesulfovibrio onnuriiensis]